jgi:hypothetical protein
MKSPRRFSLTHNVATNHWDLRDEATHHVLRSFTTKEAATRKGVLEKMLGKGGGSVTIRKKGDVFEEERRYAAR